MYAGFCACVRRYFVSLNRKPLKLYHIFPREDSPNFLMFAISPGCSIIAIIFTNEKGDISVHYSLYQLLWFFILYSFIGWVIGTSAAALRKKKFIDVGALFGPYCPSYGLGGVCFAVFLSELREHLFFLFLGGVILSFFITVMTGLILEKIFHRKWWDYSGRKMQFAGYANLPAVLLWGVSALVCIEFLNPFLVDVLSLIPELAGVVILIVVYLTLAADLAGTVSAITVVRFRINRSDFISDVSENLQKAADAMGEGLSGWVLRHLEKSYAGLDRRELLKVRRQEKIRRDAEADKPQVFARGCSFYKIVWLFFLGAFLGDITETIFCFATMGKLMSRSSVVYGPFSIVWGLGCALLTVILYQYRERSDSFIFLFGTFLGGAYEYICSVFTELVFDTVFWDYSHIPFNLGGRINLLYCFFWGIAAVVWMKWLYPFLSTLIELIPVKAGKWLSWIIIIFMSVNIVISSLALERYNQRHSGSSGEKNAYTEFMDSHFPDERMERIYPKAKSVD